MDTISLRIRGPNGVHTLRGISRDLVVAEFQNMVASSCGVEPGLQAIKSGFPPKPLSMHFQKISEWGLKNGDTLILESSPQINQVNSNQNACGASNATGSNAALFVSLLDGRGVTRRIIDSDNSCLFNSVGYCTERSRKAAQKLRQVVKETVASDPFKFNDGFLGKSNEEYQQWILHPDHWGGAIELYILSAYYKCQIAAFDVQTKRCDIYGQDQGYQQRCMLVYDGLHYDALSVQAFQGAPEEVDCTLFDVDNREAPEIMAAAQKLVDGLNEQRAFTDTANFTLRCGICSARFKGEKEAVAHAKQTGHQNFQEN